MKINFHGNLKNIWMKNSWIMNKAPILFKTTTINKLSQRTWRRKNFKPHLFSILSTLKVKGIKLWTHLVVLHYSIILRSHKISILKRCPERWYVILLRWLRFLDFQSISLGNTSPIKVSLSISINYSKSSINL